MQRISLYPGATHNYTRFIVLEINTFSIYTQASFTLFPETISSGTLQDGYNHDHLIKPTHDNNADDTEDDEDDGDDGVFIIY